MKIKMLCNLCVGDTFEHSGTTLFGHLPFVDYYTVLKKENENRCMVLWYYNANEEIQINIKDQEITGTIRILSEEEAFLFRMERQ